MEKKRNTIQKAIVMLILIIFCIQHLSIISIAQSLTELRLESKKYLILEQKGYIARIVPETTMEEFKMGFNVEKSKIHVYKDSTLKSEVTTGYIASGMYLKCDGINEKYELSVIGDLTHEGKLDQIDLNLLIKHVVGLKEAQVNGIDKISADLSGDGKIDQIDITILIRYIMYHELYVPEIKRPEAPIIEIVSGTKGIEDWYNSDVTVKIKPNNTNGIKLGKTIYKVSGSGTIQETEIKQGTEEILTMKEEGNYKITAYTYSEEGAKSTVSSKTIKIDKTAPKLSIDIESTLNTIKVKAKATDNLSGIKDYTYYIGIKGKGGNITWTQTQTTTESQYIFKNLNKGTEYYVKVEVSDKAGNKTSRETEKNTTNIPELYDEEKAKEHGVIPNVTVEKSEDDWTNKDVVIKIEVDEQTNPDGKYDIEYSKDGGETWEKYDPEKGIVVEENTDVEVRLTDGENSGEGVKIKVDNIDKNAPELELATEGRSSSITVHAHATDDLSGIKEYTYYIGKEDKSGNIVWEEGITVISPEYTFDNLEQETEYHIKVEVKDKAGNKTEKQTKEKTKRVPDLYDDEKAQQQGKEPNVTVEKSEDDWTNKDVILKVEVDEETNPDGEYDIEYSKDGGETWEKYDPEKGIVVEENTDVEIRLTDGENVGESITVEVNNIDKTAPNLTIEAEGTSNTITVKAEATDDLSGIKDYTYYIGEKDEEGNIVWKEGVTTTEKEYTFEELKQNTDYYIKVEVHDKAGNTTEKETKVHTDKIPDLYDDKKAEEQGEGTKPNITVEKSEDEWTNKDVILKVEVDEETNPDNKYDIEYSKDGGETWEKYDPEKGIVVEENADVEVRLTDGTNSGEGIVIPVNNIDKTIPQGVLNTEVTKTSITANVEATDEPSGIKEYIYYIGQKDEQGNIVYGEGIKLKENTYTFENLTEGTVYEIKVEVVDKAGNKLELQKEVTTLEDLNVNNIITITQNIRKWTNKNVTVTITAKPTEYITEYSLDGKTWEEFKDTKKAVMEENGIVYARVRQGDNASDVISLTISNIDKIEPNAKITPADITSRSFKANLQSDDNISGIAKVKWYYKAEGEELFTTETYEYAVVGSTGKGKSEIAKDYEYIDLKSGNYEICAEITDAAGNVTVTDTIIVKTLTITSGTDGIEFIGNRNWTNEDVNIIISSKDERYTILSSLDGENWTSEVKYTVTENSSIYAKLFDGINSGEQVEYKITNIDKEDIVSNIVEDEVTSKSFTVGFDITDNLSGLGRIKLYYKNAKDDNYIEQIKDFKPIKGLTAGEKDTHKQIKIDNLVKGTYKAYAIVTDVAGNEITTEEISMDLIEITEGKDALTFKPSNTNWTNQPVDVEVTNKDSRYQIQISTDGINYEQTDNIRVLTNTEVHARLTDGINVGKSTKIEITNIDISPIVATITNTNVTSKTFTVKSDIEDNASGLGKIEWYMRKKGEVEYNLVTREYQTINGKDAGELQTSKDITYENLTSGTYEVYAIITDVAGNTTTTTKIEVTLTTITNGVNGIEITSSNENWTNEDVLMTATSTDERYTVQTSKDGKTWKDENTVNYEQNGIIYARLTDGINVGEHTSREITNIDKVPSVAVAKNTQFTSRSFTELVNVTDNSSGLGKIEIYYKERWQTEWSIKEVTYQEINGNIAGETVASKNILVDELPSGTYEVYVAVTDVAGNITTTEKNAEIITLETITSAQDAITLTPSMLGWTNEPVTITATSTEKEYQIQMSTDGISWELTDSVTITENKVVYARLYDGVNAGEATSITIPNIDTVQTLGKIECTSTTSKSMNIKVNTQDDASGIGQITWYYKRDGDQLQNVTENYKTINGTEAGEYEREEEKFFDNLKNGTYTVYAVITDVAGNITTTETIRVTLDVIPSGETEITLTPNITYWTNTDVLVTATTSNTTYTLQTSTDGVNWTQDTELTITENKIVYARLFDGVNGGETGSLTVGNIDKDAPLTSKITYVPGGTSINASVTAIDNLSGIAKVVWYYKETTESSYMSVTDNYETINGTVVGSTNKIINRTLTNLIAGKKYHIYAVVYDVSGNTTQTETIEAITNRAPVVTSTRYLSKTTNSITVEATATDEDGDNLTYTLYVSTSLNGSYTSKATGTKAQGQPISLTASGLSSYTTYYYYVAVTDKIANAEGSRGSNVRTYCPGDTYRCSGGGTTSSRCGSCGGSGSKSCTGSFRAGGISRWRCSCGGDGYTRHYSCSTCGASYEEDQCTECGAGSSGSGSHSSISCSSCDGSGRIEEEYDCRHGYYSSHRYCEHDYTRQHD